MELSEQRFRDMQEREIYFFKYWFINEVKIVNELRENIHSTSSMERLQDIIRDNLDVHFGIEDDEELVQDIYFRICE